MSGCQRAAQPLSRCLRAPHAAAFARSFSTTPIARSEADARAFEQEIVAAKPQWDPKIVSSPKGEKTLFQHGVLPVGTRRRRAALSSSSNIPFEQLPYQCFQEARQVLQADREEKIREITTERARIEKVAAEEAGSPQKEAMKQNRLSSMRRHLEHLKVLADINDPLIKKRFEDGEGDMNKPIYRHLAERKWAKYQKLLIEQRISQLHIVPDIFPHFEPTADVRLAFGRRNVAAGEFVDSRVSEIPARLRVQVFDKGERLVSVFVVNPDVPEPAHDWFTSRCHYAACNIPLSPTQTSLPLSRAPADATILPWLPPFAQKGTHYQRMAVVVLEQAPGQVLDVAALREKTAREAFNLRGFADRHGIKPVGLGLFRSIWDEGTAGVMARHDIPGADVEFKRPRAPALKPKLKKKGWEAKHSSAKYSWLHK